MRDENQQLFYKDDGYTGIKELKKIPTIDNMIKVYVDFYTNYEFLSMYKNFCVPTFNLSEKDIEKQIIEKTEYKLKQINSFPKIIKHLSDKFIRICEQSYTKKKYNISLCVGLFMIDIY